MNLDFEHLADRGAWSPEDRRARQGKPCQYGGCGITHESAYQRSLRMWLCPYHTGKLS